MSDDKAEDRAKSDADEEMYKNCLDCGGPVLRPEFGGDGVCQRCGLGRDE